MSEYQLDEGDRFTATTIMKAAGLRATLPRLTILSLLKSRFSMTPAELIRELAIYHISHTTIYRSLEALKRAGLVFDVSRQGKAQVELTQYMGRHTHSMYCIACDWSRAFRNQELEKIIASVVAQTGMIRPTHELTIRGICHECRRRTS